MSVDDNATRQKDEVEALAAIYGDEWCVVDKSHNIYCIRVDDGQHKPVWTVTIQIHFTENYPSDAPPEYQLNAPWLRGEERRNLEGALADIYCENIGESIVYLWVERIREFIQNKSSSNDSYEEGIKQSSGRVVHATEEVDHGDDFDPSLVFDEMSVTDIHNHLPVPSEVWECPTITHGECFLDRRSVFQPHLAPVFHISQVKLVLNKLLENKKIANATHNIFAFRICRKDTHTLVQHGCEDDGETHAGSRMLHLLSILNAENVMVIVTRWYGGIHLGPDRFKHINNCTRIILQDCGYIKDKEEKKGPKSTGDKKKT